MEEVQDSQLTDKELYSYQWPHSSTKSLASESGTFPHKTLNAELKSNLVLSHISSGYTFGTTPLLYACSRLASYSIFKTCPTVLSCTH